MDIITMINKDEERGIDIIFRFFEEKYTKADIRSLLFDTQKYGNLTIRRGVAELAEEFNKLQVKDNNEIRKWYTDTEFYIFDLWPWNGCSMYEDKVKLISEYLIPFKPTTIVDFGGGLGTACIYYRERFPDAKIIYVDLKDSITMKFAKFFIKEMNVQNVEFMSDQEFFDSNVIASVITSTDCFEHISNLEETMYKLAEHTNVIIHDSSFMSEEVSPQHVQTNGMLWFVNVMSAMNFLPVRVMNVLVRHKIVFNQNMELAIVPV